jgi:hypothetical protein
MMTAVFRARVGTTSFHFEAVGLSRESAVEALYDGLRRHGIQYGLRDGWFEEWKEEVACDRLTVGECTRDRDPIPLNPVAPPPKRRRGAMSR